MNKTLWLSNSVLYDTHIQLRRFRVLLSTGKNRHDCVSLLLWLHVNDLMWANCTAFPVISTLVFPQKGSISLSQSDIRLFKDINSSIGDT